MRIARDGGGISQLFPDGIDSLQELPHHLFDAIRLGLQFLGFQDLPEDEAPPREIWMMPEALGKHFAAVKKRRDEKYGGSSDGAGEIENPVQNAAADALVVGD